LSKKRRRLEIAVEPLPERYLEQTAPCPVCGKDSAAIGRRALQVVFRCDRCKVVYKRSHTTPSYF
jgi:tRNA(Ile2) C34 agmatinyltransferase TiaS